MYIDRYWESVIDPLFVYVFEHFLTAQLLWANAPSPEAAFASCWLVQRQIQYDIYYHV